MPIIYESQPTKKTGVVVANGFRSFTYSDSELANQTEVDALETRLNSRFSAKSGGEHTLGFLSPQDSHHSTGGSGGGSNDQFIFFGNGELESCSFVFNFPMIYSGRALKILFYSYSDATGIGDYTLKFDAYQDDGLAINTNTFGPTFSFLVNYDVINKVKLATLIVPVANLDGVSAGDLAYIKLTRLGDTDANSGSTYFMGAEIREVAA